MVIRAAELNIKISLFSMDEFTSLKRYEADVSPDYFIESKEASLFHIPEGDADTFRNAIGVLDKQKIWKM